MRPFTFRTLTVFGLLLFLAGGAVCGAAERDPRSGVYVIWLGRDMDADVYYGQPYIAGGQVVRQWADVAPLPDRFDFSSIDKALSPLAERGLATTIQINGNKKPAWLFERVPHTEAILGHPIRDEEGTLMYWHETHREAYFSMLRAFAAHLAASKYKDTVLGIRMNFNALGTEHSSVPPEYQAVDKWSIPGGVKPGSVVPWSNACLYRLLRGSGDAVREACFPAAFEQLA